jgi:hypothetical protein
MIELVVGLALVGLILWAIESLVPMDPTIKQVIRVVIIICVVVYLLRVFGLIGSGRDIPVPQLH